MTTLQQLVKQYTDKIQYDPRVFSKDVLPYQTFAQPFNKVIQNIQQRWYRPEFERYQLNPFNQQATQRLAKLNQDYGISGAWRTSAAGHDYQNAIQGSQLAREQLLKDYSNKLLDMRDRLTSAWINPLYKSRLTKYYTSPTRNLQQGTPQYKPTLPELKNGIGGTSIISDYRI